jgi:para-nitrobenzyl esterase
MTESDAPIVETASGRVRGRLIGEIEQFIEVPYGAPPAGQARFKPPRLVAPWAGVREAASWRNRAPQNPDVAYGNAPKVFYTIQGDFYAKGMDEDCLTVNVWTPSTTDGRRRPVLFWIHGGGFTVGHAASDSYDGENFARRHDMVFVAVTHRLNAFGFLHLAGIGGSEYAGSGNAGMLDIVLALRWVRDNIASFGGDPGNVTIVGESGGGAKVSTLMVMDAADGLFHRAVCESGIALKANTVEQADAYARSLIDELGGGGIPALVNAPVEQLLAAQAHIERSDRTLAGPGPVIDGVFLADAPLAIWESGAGSSVPLMAGWTHDEVTVFATTDLDLDVEAPSAFRHDFGAGLPKLVDREAGLAGLGRFIPGGNPDALVAAQRALNPSADDADVAIALAGALFFRWPAIRLAQLRAAAGKSTYLYEFDWVSPRISPLGAPHSSDIGLFFGNVKRLYSTRGFASAEATSRAMSSALAAFAATGDPNVAGVGEWAPYTGDHRAVMVFDETSSVRTDPESEVRKALDALDPTPAL